MRWSAGEAAQVEQLPFYDDLVTVDQYTGRESISQSKSEQKKHAISNIAQPKEKK